jgi:hypothetical protein
VVEPAPNDGDGACGVARWSADSGKFSRHGGNMDSGTCAQCGTVGRLDLYNGTCTVCRFANGAARRAENERHDQAERHITALLRLATAVERFEKTVKELAPRREQASLQTRPWDADLDDKT